MKDTNKFGFIDIMATAAILVLIFLSGIISVRVDNLETDIRELRIITSQTLSLLHISEDEP